MKIAVVILNWNGKKLLETFLPSVVSFSKEAEIFLVDNASKDDSVGFVKASFPDIKIIQHQKNYGFAEGYNRGLQVIDAEVFCLLNSDVEVTENWLKPIITCFEQEPKTAIIQPKLLDYKNKEYFEYAGAAGGYIDKFGYPYCRGRIFNTIEKDHGQFNDEAAIFWASGAAFFIRSDVYRSLGGLDASFFAHMEEIDLCWRAFNQGFETKYIGKSTVYHLGGATLKNTDARKVFLNFRNSLYTLTKNAHGFLPFLILVRLVLDGFAGMKFIFEGKPKFMLAVVKAHFGYYRHFFTFYNQRRCLDKKKKYFQITSIVIQYFVNKNKYFKSL
ncbi:glycosyltransferase family 2 protein [Gaetbulibacter aestuarii]|uniref:Glycosyltransferase family 2 protein n=1 Tax=Gaetbulibacter aestuarii TaxID=1502358 RepID=A0ABW7MZG0_9FLAO